MPQHFADDAVREFLTVLEDIEAGTAFLQAASRLRPRLMTFVDQNLIVSADQRALFSSFLKLRDVDREPLFRGVGVVFSGAFEAFVRRILKDAIVHLNHRAATYDQISEKLKAQNVIRTGRVLMTYSEPLEFLQTDFSSLIQNLASCSTGAKSFTLNADAFAISISNITSGHLEEIYKCLNVALNWDDFGRIAEFERLLNTKGAKATGKAVAENLDRFTKLRNKIAHTGTSGITVTDEYLSFYFSYFRIFAPALATMIAKGLR